MKPQPLTDRLPPGAIVYTILGKDRGSSVLVRILAPDLTDISYPVSRLLGLKRSGRWLIVSNLPIGPNYQIVCQLAETLGRKLNHRRL